MNEQSKFRRQLVAAMLVLALVPMVILVGGGIVLVGNVVEQSSEDSRSLASLIIDTAYDGFIQTMLHDSSKMLHMCAAVMDYRLPEGTPMQERIDWMYAQEEYIESLEYEGSIVYIEGDTVLASAAEGGHTLEDVQRMLDEELNPRLPGLYTFEGAPDVRNFQELMEEIPNSSTYIRDPMLSFVWIPYENGYLASFSMPEGGIYFLNQLSNLSNEMQIESQNKINALVREGGLLLGALVLVVAATAIILAGRLSKRVSDPVIKREAEQLEKLRTAEEENAMLANLNRMKTEFLSNISHELKTPLTVISSQLQMGQERMEYEIDQQDIERRMKLVTGEAERMALMVGQLVDIGRIDEGRMHMNMGNESVVEIIQTTLNTYYPVFSKGGNSLVFRAEGEIPNVYCDRGRITQVLVNLISNAARHTKNGEIAVSVAQEGESAAITVADNGEGIPPELMPHLFERYSGGKKKRAANDTGTGLGLFISKHIIEAHNGSINISSELGKGTQASFTIPLENDMQQTA